VVVRQWRDRKLSNFIKNFIWGFHLCSEDESDLGRL